MSPSINPAPGPLQGPLGLLPDEFLEPIWIEIHALDPDFHSVENLHKVCRGWYTLSKDVDLRAECFLARSTPAYAVFEAIVYPKVFTLELYQLLRKKGALLSMALVQQLYSRYVSRDLQEVDCDWGLNIRKECYKAIEIEGYELYGDFMNKVIDHDLWSRWYTGSIDLEEKHIEALILERNFAPLALPWKDSRSISSRSNLMNMLRSYEIAIRLRIARKYLTIQQFRTGGDPHFLHPAVQRLQDRLPIASPQKEAEMSETFKLMRPQPPRPDTNSRTTDRRRERYRLYDSHDSVW
ncbi:hypothetical protein BCV69DRAFT_149742 [Microstroma glucosiphilum]|uniref:Uncharacterized protein n=1 Tax=Pseudomicrostroma glucosiphilum TaxID=1684307 RepID=A0A316UBG3_9BASI|nr:hypothetical protein BCV69DRAFT_149742 [Pseudomicrostroma glucosiphilum]PWN22567.1 hypothetical protein BCV69DRAFT_149742 [Pseudomicrostroma glucosiphilum]